VIAVPFYDSAQYEALRHEEVPVGPPGGNIVLSERIPAIRDLLLDEFQRVAPERLGILHGEYLLLGNGTVLVDREGNLLVSCSALGAPVAAGACEQPDIKPVMQMVREQWDHLAVLTNCLIFTDPWADNYFHFSLSVLPRLRHFDAIGPVAPVLPESHRRRRFQTDLLARALRGSAPWPLAYTVRVRDPILAHDGDQGCRNAARWLRGATGLSARPGKRRIYIRRSAKGTRILTGGGISESPGFLALLRDFDFETIEFGNGETDVASQVAMLEGAGLVLAPHGAAQTNLAYLGPELTLIEVFGNAQINACFMRLSAWMGFDYQAICSDVYDAAMNIIVDLDELRDALRARVRLPQFALACA
jgi:hypothetical protein